MAAPRCLPHRAQNPAYGLLGRFPDPTGFPNTNGVIDSIRIRG